jgi:hypothetical protein
MVHAMIIRPPVLGGKLRSFDAEAAKAVTGVIDVFELEPLVPQRDLLQGSKGWCGHHRRVYLGLHEGAQPGQGSVGHDGPNENRDAANLFGEFDAMRRDKFDTRIESGDVEKGLAIQSKKFLPHTRLPICPRS